MNTKRITRISLLTALALIIFIVEAQIPPLAPIPGIKLGLANVITLITMAWFGKKDAFFVLILRIILGSIFAGTAISFVYSVSGGLLCFIAMSLTIPFFKGNTIWIVSVFGAIAHNIGQIVAAIILTETPQIAAYLPILIISAVITGAFTGLCAQLIIKRKSDIYGGHGN